MDKMLLKKNRQMEQSPPEMDMIFQLETPVISHSVDTQEHPESREHAPTVSAVPSLVNGCSKGGFGGEVSQDSDSDSSSSSSSSSSAPMFENAADDEGLSQAVPFKTKDEIFLEDLPAVEELTVSLPDDVELMPVGTVSSIIHQLVIIESVEDSPPLTDDSIIFGSDRLALGKVFEVFGPVSRPLYVLRFNSPDELSSKGLTLGLVVYYAPDMKEYTGYILLQQLKLLKGSDASWKNDQEPPEEALDYSDDEKEQQAKRRVKNRKKKHNSTESLTLDTLQPHHVTSRHTGALIRDHNVNDNQPPFCHSHQLPLHTNVSSGFHAPPYLYPPHPPSPLTFPPYPPPSFFSPSYASQFWQPHSVPFSKLPPPPPPPQ
ncbi:H/ACA ribonucleoprotein complex non-core subunit NAF1 [Phyllopteryx taeniolatus]|uniref:H/ACA ribonucleoprotein complex non-core subunit NAF1 n=1 Tax=Phyllopteryx taeniolatus TaxID=161469 RepID=UPI002AD4F8DD|nr:H/ACA ribonucleoprotein complex non-core subunit NAF1 [Phyllopteryx taeniolatus]